MYSPPQMLVLWIQIIIYHFEIDAAKATNGQKRSQCEFSDFSGSFCQFVYTGMSFIVNIWSVSRLFPKVFLIHNQFRKP